MVIILLMLDARMLDETGLENKARVGEFGGHCKFQLFFRTKAARRAFNH